MSGGKDSGFGGVPYREPVERFLRRSLTAERDPKTQSTGQVSEAHYRALEEVRDHLARGGRYSRRQVALSNILETSIELLYAHVFDGRRIR